METHGHNFSRWHEKVWQYFPVDMPPEFYTLQYNRWVYIEPAARLGNKILEIGAQTFLACIYLKARYANIEVVGSDIHTLECNWGLLRAKRWGVRLPIVNCDAFNLPFKDDAFDVVLSEGLHEHFDKRDISNLVGESARVAKYQIINVPTTADFERGGGYGDERHLTDLEWRELFQSIGRVEIIEEFRRNTNYCAILKRKEV